MAVSNADILGWLNENPGADDTLIANTMREAGVSPEQMAQSTGLNYGDVSNRYNAALGISSLPAANTPAVVTSAPTLTVEDLYQQYAGRASDPEGLSYWTQGFGDSIDANEIASFQQAVAEARAQGTEPAAKTTTATTTTNTASGIPSLLDTNTSTAVATPNYKQMVMDAYATIGRTGVGEGANQIDQAGFDAWTQALQTGQIKPEDLNNTFQAAVVDYLASKPEDKYSTYVTDYLTDTKPAAVSGIVSLYEDVLGRAPDAKGLADWYRQFGSEISPEERAQFELVAKSELDSRTQNLYSEFMGSGRIAEQEGLDYWRGRFGNEIDASEKEEFRNAAAAELSGAFGTGGLDAVAGFKYAKDLGVNDAGLKLTLGEDLYNQYQNQLKSATTKSINDIVADNSATFEESQKVANLARDLGYNSQQLADLTGKDKSLFDTLLTNYDSNSKKIINDTLAGANILTDADRVVASYALEKQFGFTDDELSKATGVDVNVIKKNLDPVRNFETDFSKIANNTDSTTQQIKDFVTSAKANSAIDKLYGSSLTGYENKIAELETKWSAYGSDAIQSENLFQQLNAQKNALGGQYFKGVFGDLQKSTALLVNKGLDTLGDLGQKDKFQTTQATERSTTADGRPVTKQGNEYFLSETNSEGNSVLGAKVDPSSVTTKYFKSVTEGDGENSYSTLVPLSEAELATVKDGSYQQKIGSVVIDKDTGAELTDTTGQIAFQKSGGFFTGKNNWLNVNFTKEGVPYLTASKEKTGINAFVSEMGPMIISVAAVIPGPHQPFAQIANAAIALEQKNYLGAVLSGLSSYGTFTGNELATLKAAEASGDIINSSRVLDLQNTASNIKLAQTAISGVAALQADNVAGVINAGLSAYGQTGGTLPSGVTTAFQAANLAIALESNNASAALASLGDLTGSKDLYVAASAKNLIDALQSGNQANIMQAGLVLGNSFKASNQSTTTNTTTDTTTPTTIPTTTPTNTVTTDVINTLQNAGLTEDEFNLPTGIQLAATDTGTTSDAGGGYKVDVGGAPIYAESSNASKVSAPFGYRLMSTSESDERPAGAYYDSTANAWFTPSGEVEQLSALLQQPENSDFWQSIGIDQSTLSSLDGSPSNKEILDLIGYQGDTTDTAAVSKFIEGKQKEVSSEIETLNVTSKGDVDTDNILVTTKKEVPELVVTTKKEIPELVVTAQTTVPTTEVTTPTVATTTPTEVPEIVVTSKTTTPTVEPTVKPTATPTTPTVRPTTPTVKPTVKSTVSGYTMPQAQNIAAAFGIPALANVFYYGKDFGSKKQKLDKKGEVQEEEYKPLSVTAPGAAGELVEEQKNKENNANDALDLILGESSNSMSVDDLLDIVKKG